jgi:hypothetical protein
MMKHRGFPSRLPSSDLHFTIRRPGAKGATPLKARKRYADRKPVDRAADREFLAAIWEHFGEQPFERGNLDAGRLNWLLEREVVAAEENFDPASYEALLRIDLTEARRSFPAIFGEG